MDIEGLLWLMIVLVAVTALLLLPARRREARGRGAPADRPEELTELRSRAARVADEVDRMRLELEELHREVAARTDDKLRLLAQLIAQADQRIDALRRAAGDERPGPR